MKAEYSTIALSHFAVYSNPILLAIMPNLSTAPLLNFALAKTFTVFIIKSIYSCKIECKGSTAKGNDVSTSIWMYLMLLIYNVYSSYVMPTCHVLNLI